MQRSKLRLFDHLVGAGEKRGRHVEAEGLGGFQIDDQLVFRQLLDWERPWRCSSQNFVNVSRTTPRLLFEVSGIG
jgi:hypothetical protein